MGGVELMAGNIEGCLSAASIITKSSSSVVSSSLGRVPDFHLSANSVNRVAVSV